MRVPNSVPTLVDKRQKQRMVAGGETCLGNNAKNAWISLVLLLIILFDSDGSLCLYDACEKKHVFYFSTCDFGAYG